MLENVYLVLGRDLNKTVAFFRQVDRLKPPREAVMAQQGISDEKDVRLVRAYEAAVAQTITKALLEHSGRITSARIK
jgi:NACalpha-BTF3-like transcription factor